MTDIREAIEKIIHDTITKNDQVDKGDYGYVISAANQIIELVKKHKPNVQLVATGNYYSALTPENFQHTLAWLKNRDAEQIKKDNGSEGNVFSAALELIDAQRAQVRILKTACSRMIAASIETRDLLESHVLAWDTDELAKREANMPGWQWVPKIETEEMLAAGNKASLSTDILLDDTRYSCERATYRAMLAVAPKPQAVK